MTTLHDRVSNRLDVALLKALEEGTTTTLTVTIGPAGIEVSSTETWVEDISEAEVQLHSRPTASELEQREQLLNELAPLPLAVGVLADEEEQPTPAPTFPTPTPTAVPTASKPTPDPKPVTSGGFTFDVAPLVMSLGTPEVVSLHPKPNSPALDDELVLPGRMTNDPATDPYFMDVPPTAHGIVLEDTNTMNVGDILELPSIWQGFSVEVMEVDEDDNILIVSPSHEIVDKDDEEQCAEIAAALASDGCGTWEVLLF